SGEGEDDARPPQRRAGAPGYRPGPGGGGAMSRVPTLALPPPPAQGPWLVGYSGGLDSTVLLHRLAREDSGRTLRAIHVHHGLQAGADHWAAHCERTCRALGVAFQVVRIEVARGSGEGLEAAARRGRMAAFAQALEDGGGLALAPHRDDQAETPPPRALARPGRGGARSRGRPGSGCAARPRGRLRPGPGRRRCAGPRPPPRRPGRNTAAARAARLGQRRARRHAPLAPLRPWLAVAPLPGAAA